MQPEVLKLYGVKTMEQGLKKLQPELYKEMKVAITRAALNVAIDARKNITASPPWGLSNWMKMKNPTALTQSQASSGVRTFPLYDAAVMKRNIKVRQRRGKTKADGFAALIQVVNNSPGGNIYEKAGVVPLSTRPNRSRNRMAQYDFKMAMQNYESISKGRGRAVIKAGRADAGKTRVIIARIQRNADLELQKWFNKSDIQKAYEMGL